MLMYTNSLHLALQIQEGNLVLSDTALENTPTDSLQKKAVILLKHHIDPFKFQSKRKNCTRELPEIRRLDTSPAKT